MALKARNMTCCAVLYRAQIDLCMRTYAPFIAKDSQELIQGYIDGEPIRKYKSKDGEKLTDAYLRKQLDTRFPGLSASYSQASDFVHFSKEAFSLIARTEEENVITMGIGVNHSGDMDDSLIDLGNAVIGAANLHLSLMYAVVKSRISDTDQNEF